jgi:hypothetical protein
VDVKPNWANPTEESRFYGDDGIINASSDPSIDGFIYKNFVFLLGLPSDLSTANFGSSLRRKS